MSEIVLNNKTFVRRKNTQQGSQKKTEAKTGFNDITENVIDNADDGCSYKSNQRRSDVNSDDNEFHGKNDDEQVKVDVAYSLGNSSLAAEDKTSPEIISKSSHESKKETEDGSASILLIDQTLGILKRSDITTSSSSRYNNGLSNTRGSNTFSVASSGRGRSTPTLFDYYQNETCTVEDLENKKEESTYPSTASSTSTSYSTLSLYGKKKDMKRPSRSRTSILFETRRRRKQKEEHSKKYGDEKEDLSELKIDDDYDDEEEDDGGETTNDERSFQDSEDYSKYTNSGSPSSSPSSSSYSSSSFDSSSYNNESDATYNSNSEREGWVSRKGERKLRKEKHKYKRERQYSSRKSRGYKMEDIRERRRRRERKRREKESVERENRLRKKEKRERYLRGNKRKSKKSNTIQSSSRRPKSMDNLTLKRSSSGNSNDFPVSTTGEKRKRLVSSALSRHKHKSEKDVKSENKNNDDLSPPIHSSSHKGEEILSDEDEQYILGIWDDFEQEWTAWNKKNNKIHSLLEKAASVSTENERKSHLSKIKSGKIKFANHLTEKYLCKLLDPLPAAPTIRKVRKRIVNRISKIEEEFTNEDEQQLHRHHKLIKKDSKEAKPEEHEAMTGGERKSRNDDSDSDDKSKSQSQPISRFSSLNQNRNNIPENKMPTYKLNKTYLTNDMKQEQKVSNTEISTNKNGATEIEKSRNGFNFLKPTQSRLRYGTKGAQSTSSGSVNDEFSDKKANSPSNHNLNEISPIEYHSQQKQKQIDLHMKQPENSVANFYFGGNLRSQMGSTDDIIHEIVKTHDEKHAAVGSIKEIRQKAREQLEREDKTKLEILNKRQEEKRLLEKEERTGKLTMRESALLDKLRTERIIQEEKEKESEIMAQEANRSKSISSARQVSAEDILTSNLVGFDEQKEAATAPLSSENNPTDVASATSSPKESSSKRVKLKGPPGLNPLRNSLFKKGTGKLSLARNDHEFVAEVKSSSPLYAQKAKAGPETITDSPENDEEEHKVQTLGDSPYGDNEHEDLNWVCGVCSKTNAWKECKCIVCGREKGSGKKKSFYDNYATNRSIKEKRNIDKENAKFEISKRDRKILGTKLSSSSERNVDTLRSNNNEEESKDSTDDLPSIPKVDPNIALTNKLLEAGARQEKESADLTSDIQSLLSNIRSINIDSI